jgi:hypothetical protein
MHLRRADPVEPPEQHGHRTRVVAESVACSFEQAQFGAPVCVDQLARIGHRDAVVLLAVHHQQRARREPSR